MACISAIDCDTMAAVDENVKQGLKSGFNDVETTKISVERVLDQIKQYQECVRTFIEDNYVDFMPHHTNCEIYISDGETLLRETEHFLKNIDSDARISLIEANSDLSHCVEELSEVSLGLHVSHRILKIHDLFQCVEEAKATKDFLIVLDLLSKLKYLICSESISEVDFLFQKCDCYDAIRIKYHIQENILQQNLQQKFDRLVQFSEKSFSSAKIATIRVSTNVGQLQDTVMALFQARYNPMKICDFLLEKCLIPMITKPTSVEYSTDNDEYLQLNISYSVKEIGKSLRPSYKHVFSNITKLLDCLKNINVCLSEEQHVLTIIGSHIKERLLTLILDECLMLSVPETIGDYQESTLVDDVLRFEQILADAFFIDPEIDCGLSKFTNKFETYFKQRFSKSVLETAREIMQKDLQDMVTIADGNTIEAVAKNPFLFPQCVISKSTLELIKLMEGILRQPMDTSSSTEVEKTNNFIDVIPIILNTYLTEVPKFHEKLLKNIPQQAVLFYNNCMFLSHWVARNAETGIPTHSALVKMLQSTGVMKFKAQVIHQQQIIAEILKECDLSGTHSIGFEPLKSVRQCLRQMDLLKNVWLNILPDDVYNATFRDLLNDFCLDIITRIISLQDISATVASELSELIDIILLKAPSLFKENHEVLRVSSWMKMQQLKIILNASLQEITEQWCDGAGVLTANYKPEEIRHLVRALFQNTDRRSKALSRID